jgi:predicted glycosyltransferase
VTGSALFYVQHLLGIGHLQRALRIVEALAREGIEVTLVSGGELPALVASASAKRVVQLAPVRSADASFKGLVDTSGRPINDRLRQTRRTALLEALAVAQPDAVIIEAYPFGRRAFRFELDPLIDAVRSCRPRPLVLCSLRDIVIAPEEPKRLRETVDRVRADFDFVLVHGDPAFIPLEASFPLASEISDRVIYTGYVSGAGELNGAEGAIGADEVLVSAGGGAVGGALLSTALEARLQGCLAGFNWRLLAGPNLPEREFYSLASRLPDRTILERYRPDFPQMLRQCRVSVSQAGYNSILDVLAARAAAVVVPFTSVRETEQSLRAETLAARGILEVVRESALSPELLAAAIDRAISRKPATIAIDTEGARRSAKVVAEMIRSSAIAVGAPSRPLCPKRPQV